jgi:hypothetical protein
LVAVEDDRLRFSASKVAVKGWWVFSVDTVPRYGLCSRQR